MISEILLVLFARFGFQENAVVRKLLRPLEIKFYEKEDDAAENGGQHVPPIRIVAPHLECRPCKHDRDRRKNQDRRVHRADWNVEQTVWPFARSGIESQKNVSREKSAKEHHFGREKQPDADLRVPQTGVRPSGYGVRDFHSLMPSANEPMRVRPFVSIVRPARPVRFAWWNLFRVSACRFC